MKPPRHVYPPTSRMECSGIEKDAIQTPDELKCSLCGVTWKRLEGGSIYESDDQRIAREWSEKVERALDNGVPNLPLRELVERAIYRAITDHISRHDVERISRERDGWERQCATMRDGLIAAQQWLNASSEDIASGSVNAPHESVSKALGVCR